MFFYRLGLDLLSMSIFFLHQDFDQVSLANVVPEV